ncbi:Uncharacterised protein [Segatella copri]|nr:Uncharacterised protein [Segatella copri]
MDFDQLWSFRIHSTAPFFHAEKMLRWESSQSVSSSARSARRAISSASLSAILLSGFTTKLPLQLSSLSR